MSDDPLDSCGCCDPANPEPVIDNPPGLSAVAYRIGIHPTFLRRMLAQLPREGVENGSGELAYPLTRLATRAPDDPAIALLDAWATVGDVLTFYQERIANEGYLRTATERRSVLELARLIGYELNPGVAASAFLAFAVDSAPGAPPSVAVAAGAKVQSIPGQNELPQTFEMSEAITARIEWNTLRPRQLRPQELAISGGKLYLLGLSVGFGPGAGTLDVVDVEPLDAAAPLPATGSVPASEVNVIYLAGEGATLKAGDVMLFVGRKSGGATAATLARVVRSIQAEHDLDRTRVELESPAPPPPITYFPGKFAAAAASIEPAVLSAQTVDAAIVNQSWSETQLGAFLGVQGWSVQNLLAYTDLAYTGTRPRPKLSPADPGAFAFRARVGFFGHTAPPWLALTPAISAKFVDWDSHPVSIWKDSQTTPAYYADADCFLERVVPGITDDGWAAFQVKKAFTVFRVTSAIESSPAAFALAAKATGLNLAKAADGAVLESNTTDKSEAFKVRATTALVASERVILAPLPIEDAIGAGSAEETQLTLDRMILNLEAGQRVAVTGERADLPGAVVSEVVALAAVEHSGGFTTLSFASPGLAFSYLRATVTLNANVALATHGETVSEVLGSGDGAQANQRFTLRKPPLTYTASSGETGAQSSLEVRVNGLRWDEAPTLYGLDATSERYAVRIADDGKASVTFGDGEVGARLSTGVENVVGTYRSGIGRPGMVAAGTLTLLMTRPLGMRGVSNPLPASGAADPENRDQARTNAPLGVLAMGRVVSLEDAEDFARAFAGIGKTSARALWRGGTHWVHLTVAAAAAIPPPPGATTALPDYRVDPESPLGLNLVQAIETFKEPSMPVRVDTYQPLYWNVTAKLGIDPRYRWEDVETATRAALASGFAFARRGFGQAVTTSEVVSLIQNVAGVVFVDLEELRRFDVPTPPLPPRGALLAAPVVWGEDEAEPSALAQLLLINPLGITLTQAPLETAP